MFFGGTIGVGLQSLEDRDVAPQVLGFLVVLDQFLEFGNALNGRGVTI